MLEFRVPASQFSAELEYFRQLKTLKAQHNPIEPAMYFARRWEDLAHRVLAVMSAQTATDIPVPPAVALTALRAFLAHGPGFTPEQFTAYAGQGWPARTTGLLADLASWYSSGYETDNPLANSLQAWAGSPGDREIQLYGPGCKTIPPPPFKLLSAPPTAGWLSEAQHRPVALIAHYDVHGLSMLALTQRYLHSHGVTDIDSILSFELTGDISKLWKRTVPRALTHDRGYAAVVMIDCSVHSRKPEYTLKAVSKLDEATDCHLVLIDHHTDTSRLAPELLRDRLSLALTDVPLCGLCDSLEHTDRRLMTLGAIGDKVPDISLEHDNGDDDLTPACEAFHHRLIHFSPTPREMKKAEIMPTAPLWQALANGEEISAGLATRHLGELEIPPKPDLPECLTCGSVTFVTQRLTSVGRTWYNLLERLMKHEGVPYAAALRILDESRANMLLLTDWRAVDHPPIRYFVPDEFGPRCLGHLTAVWVDVERHQALSLLSEVAWGINEFCGSPADFEAIAQALTVNIISPPAPLPQ